MTAVTSAARLGDDVAAATCCTSALPERRCSLLAMPIVLLLLFVYVFGGTLGAGLPPAPSTGTGRAAYARLLAPGIAHHLAGVAQATAIASRWT